MDNQRSFMQQDGFFAKNMEWIGSHDLDEKPGFKLALQVRDGRWFLYVTHIWEPGWTILDVTRPETPEKLAFLPGPPHTWTLQVQVADGLMITSLEPVPSHWGGGGEAYEEGVYIWDVQDPVRPRLLSHWRTGSNGTHRNHYHGGRYAHLAAGKPGFAGRIYVILDLEDPARPKEAGHWFLPEQYIAGGAPTPDRFYSLHGPPYVHGDRAYLSYGRGGVVILDIRDVSQPKLISRMEFGPSIGSALGIHSVVPLPRRNLAIINTEAIQERCDEPMNFAGVVDISDVAHPRLLSFFPVPEPPPTAPYRNFHTRGGRFGPHNQHHPQQQPHLEQREDRIYLTYFNAGLRVVDVQDPYLPREIGYFVPPDPKVRRGLLPKTALVSQAEDVLVDARGYIYLTDKTQGLFILRCTQTD